MKIVRGTDLIDIPHPVFVIQGDTGVGKTSLIWSMTDAVCFDIDRGAHRARNRGDSLRVDNYADLKEFVEPEKLAEWKSVGVDTGGKLLDIMKVAIATENAKWARGDGDLSQQGFGELKRRFKWWLDELLKQNKNVLILAHAKEDKKKDEYVYRPDMTGGSYNEVLRMADFVGYMHKERGQRVIDFEPSDAWIGKNPAGWDTRVVPDYAHLGTFMADLFEEGRKALGRLSNENAAIKKAVAEWQSRMPTIGTADGINAAIPEATALPPFVAVQAKRMIRDRAKELGLAWSDAEKKYAVAAAAPAVADADKPTPVTELRDTSAPYPQDSNDELAVLPSEPVKPADAPKEQADKPRKRS